MKVKKNLKKIVALLLLLTLFTASTTGCWNRRELDTLAIVMATAFDKAQEPDRILITTQIVRPEAFGAEGGGGVGYFNLSSTGNTIFEASRNQTAKLDRRLFYPFNELILFSEEIAQGGLGPYLDFFVRDHEPRLQMPVLVTEGRAMDYLHITRGIERLPSRYMAKIIERQANSLGQVPHVRLFNFIQVLHSETREPVAAIMELRGEGDSREVFLKETAVFKGDKMVGRLNRQEGRGYLWINNEINSGVIVVKCPIEDSDEAQNISLEISNSRTSLIPIIRDGSIYMEIKVSMESNLTEQLCSHDLTTPETWASLEAQQATVIKNEIMAAVAKAQELNSDIFGFGEALHRRYPQAFREIVSHWDDYFPSIEVITEINSNVRRTMLTTKPVQRN